MQGYASKVDDSGAPGSTPSPECGILAHGFLRLRCSDSGHDKLPQASWVLPLTRRARMPQLR